MPRNELHPTLDALVKVRSEVAWGDESSRMDGPLRVYLMCATMFADGSEDAIANFAKVKPAGMRKLHWYDMSDFEKRRSLEALAEIPHWNTVAVASFVPGAVRPERARRKCLEQLLPALEALGCEKLVLEGRWKQEDHSDLAMAFALQNRRMIERIRIEHMDPGAGEPRLWVPDQVLGAYGESLCALPGRERWKRAWGEVSKRLTILNAPL